MTPVAPLLASAAHALHGDGSLSLVPWHTPPSVLIGTLALAAGYLWATGPWRESLGIPDEPAKRHRRTAWFMAGLSVMFLALTGPIHDVSDYYLFSGHMVQHLLITMVVPPMLIRGVPEWLVETALEVRWIRRVAEVLVRPLVAGVLFSVVMVVWHVPELYDLSLRNHDVHIAEHLSFMVTSVIVWWPILSPYEAHRPSWGVQMIYLFLLGLPMKLVGAFITLSESVVYTFYLEAPRVWPYLTPLADQQVGGLLMWVPGGFTFWGVMTVIFFRWYAEEGDPIPRAPAIGAAERRPSPG